MTGLGQLIGAIFLIGFAGLFAAIDAAMRRLDAPASLVTSYAGTAQAFQNSISTVPLLILAALVAVFVLTPVVTTAQTIAAELVASRAVARAAGLTAELAGAPTVIEHLEDSTQATRLAGLVRSQHYWTFQEGVVATWQVFGLRLTGLGATLLAASWNWWPALALAACTTRSSSLVPLAAPATPPPQRHSAPFPAPPPYPANQQPGCWGT